MPPLIVRINVLSRAGRSVRLWIPLFLLWLLMLPFVIVVLPVALVLCIVADIDPFPAIGAMWNVVCSLNGTHVEVDAPDACIFFHIY